MTGVYHGMAEIEEHDESFDTSLLPPLRHCSACGKETPHIPHPVDVSVGGDYLRCEICGERN